MPSYEDAADAIAAAVSTTPSTPAVRWRWGTVEGVNAGGTMNVNVGGVTVPGIRAAAHAMVARVGDRVRVAYYGTDAFVDAVRANSTPQQGQFVGAFYSSNNRATITLPRAGRYTILAIHNSTPTLNGIAFATGDTVFKIAGAASITFTRSGNTITATTTGGNPGYYVTAYDF